MSRPLNKPTKAINLAYAVAKRTSAPFPAFVGVFFRDNAVISLFFVA